jgi:four helix bundle protein
MAAARCFTELQFWQRARQWSKRIYELTQREPFLRDQRLVTQINDSSESVMSNIAEGFGRGTQGEFVLFPGYALGSLDETRSHLCAAFDRAHLTREEVRRGVSGRDRDPQDDGGLHRLDGDAEIGRQELAQDPELERSGLGALRAHDWKAAAGNV